VKIYVNGELKGSSAKTWAMPSNGYNTVVGFWNNKFFPGLIDEVRVYNQAKSKAWIKASFHSGNNTLITWGEEEEEYGKGLIPVGSGEPFYTNATSNPITINLNATQSQLITIWVNATGEIGTTHTFFEYANLTADSEISNSTTKWNVTILLGTIDTFTSESPTENIYVNYYTQVKVRTNETIGNKTKAEYTIPYNIALINTSTIYILNNQSQTESYDISGNDIVFNVNGSNSSYYDVFYKVLFANETKSVYCAENWTVYNPNICYSEHYSSAGHYRYYNLEINITTNITAQNYNIYYNISTEKLLGWESNKYNVKISYNESIANITYNSVNKILTVICGNNHTDNNKSLLYGVNILNINYHHQALSGGGGNIIPLTTSTNTTSTNTTSNKDIIVIIEDLGTTDKSNKFYSYKYNIYNNASNYRNLKFVIKPSEYSNKFYFDGIIYEDIKTFILLDRETKSFIIKVPVGLGCNLNQKECEKIELILQNTNTLNDEHKYIRTYPFFDCDFETRYQEIVKCGILKERYIEAFEASVRSHLDTIYIYDNIKIPKLSILLGLSLLLIIVGGSRLFIDGVKAYNINSRKPIILRKWGLILLFILILYVLIALFVPAPMTSTFTFA